MENFDMNPINLSAIFDILKRKNTPKIEILLYKKFIRYSWRENLEFASTTYLSFLKTLLLSSSLGRQAYIFR